MQLIQQQSFFHEKNDAADSTACFSFWGGRLGPLGPGPPRMGKNEKNKTNANGNANAWSHLKVR